MRAQLHVQVRARLRVLAPGLTPRSMLEKFAAIQMLDGHDGRELVFAPYTQPEKDHKMLLSQLGWRCPCNPRPGLHKKANCSKIDSLLQTFAGPVACSQVLTRS